MIVRFSNALGAIQPDSKKDMRGVALRIEVSKGEQHDLLMTNFPVSHARNADQFVKFAVATAGNRFDRIVGLVRLVFQVGPWEVLRMIRNVSAARKRAVSSLALETYWSRGAICWGRTLAVRYLLRPAAEVGPGSDAAEPTAEYLRRDFARRLKTGDVAFDLYIQRFVDETTTPIEDTAIEWLESKAPAGKGGDADDSQAGRRQRRCALDRTADRRRSRSTPGTPPTNFARWETSTAPARLCMTRAPRTA